MTSKEKTTQKTYDSISKHWDLKRQVMWEPIQEFLSSFENKSELKLLDLGCGTGRVLEYSNKIGFEKNNLTGCDYSEGQLEIVKEKGFKTVNANMLNLPFKENEFNIITCIAAYHHLLNKKDQIQALIEMKKILKPEGKILLSNWFPEKKYLETETQKGKFQFIKNQIAKVTYTSNEIKSDRYYYLFEEPELIELCKKAKLNILNKEYNKGNLYLTLN